MGDQNIILPYGARLSVRCIDSLEKASIMTRSIVMRLGDP